MKVISVKNLPVRLPFWPTVVTALALDRLHAPDWVTAIFGTLFALWWLAAIVGHVRQQSVEIFPEQS